MSSEESLKFFACQEEFREWLENNALNEEVLWVGYYKKATGYPSITWSESVDQALCFGWIDGLRKRIDEEAYKIRFTPRRKNSHWSKVNLRRFPELQKMKMVTTAGEVVYKARNRKKEGLASYEQDKVTLEKQYIDAIKKNKKAWLFYSKLAPSYKKATDWFVMSAKKEETRLRRLAILIENAEQGLKIPQLRGRK